MRSIRQEQLKAELHQELKLRYREFFESKLALELLLQKGAYPSLKKISAAILKLIQGNEKIVIDLMASNPSISLELREPYFGALFESKEEVKPQRALGKMVSILNDDAADIRQVMQIHCIFVHRIYDHLEKKADKAEFVRQLFPASLFSKENRSREEFKSDKNKPTTQLGISRLGVFSKMLGQSSQSHVRALDRFKLDNGSALFKLMIDKNIPHVCGPSGHAGSLLLGAKLYGDLSKEEIKEYACLSFAFLAAGGNHSFHEVMIVANQLGVDFELGNYTVSIPESIKRIQAFKKLSEQFSEFLSEPDALLQEKSCKLGGAF